VLSGAAVAWGDPNRQACSKLQIVLVSDDHLERTAYNARTLELGPLPNDAVAGALKATHPDMPEVGPAPAHAHACAPHKRMRRSGESDCRLILLRLQKPSGCC
jgi:hypothetical protein